MEKIDHSDSYEVWMKLKEILHENDEQLSESEIYQTIMDGNGSFSMMKQER